jgi:hypothetical protein
MSKGRRPGAGRHPSAPRRSDAIAILTPDGPVVAIVHNVRVRSEISRHLNAVRRYIETGDARRLRAFKGLRFGLDDDTQLEFVTDPATLDRLAEGSALHFELYRR